jgi:hypothetical protein
MTRKLKVWMVGLKKFQNKYLKFKNNSANLNLQLSRNLAMNIMLNQRNMNMILRNSYKKQITRLTPIYQWLTRNYIYKKKY